MTRWLEASHKYMLLRSAARKLAWELGGNAYLVGSALTSEVRPRDVDVRIVLPDETFTQRFGLTPEDWQWQARTCHWTEPRWAWHRQEEACKVLLACASTERTIDLGIIPSILWTAVYEQAPHEVWGAWADYVSASMPQVTDPAHMGQPGHWDIVWGGQPQRPREEAIDVIYALLGQRIREAREAAKINQQKLAELVGMERTSITNIESGRQRPPLYILYDIARVLAVPIYTLLPVGGG